MAVPLIVWGLVAGVGAVIGGGAVVAVTDSAEDLADAADKTGKAINGLLTTTAIVGSLYLAWTFRDEIKGLLK